MSATRYSCTLQTRIDLADNQWEYTVHNLPEASVTNSAKLSKSIAVLSNNTEQSITLSYTSLPPNRATSGQLPDRLLHFTCANFRLYLHDGNPATFRESTGYIARMLKNGITINKTRYSFYGHSNSQLKSRSCILISGTQDDVDKEVEALGNFNMKTVAKKVKRIGLLFSSAHTVITIDPARCRDVPDIIRDQYIFTDGCGNISAPLARLLAQKMPIVFRNRKHYPSVFQIRYRGYKGVVILDPELKAPVSLEFRESMRKFSGGQDFSFAVVEYSKPFTYGYLNDEVVLLLHALGIAQSVLEAKQQDHFHLLDQASTNPIAAFRLLSSLGEHDLAERLLMDGIESCRAPIGRLVTKERTRMINKRELQKSRIFIPRSRLLFGVCDHRGVLQEGECFVKPTMDEDGLPHALTGSYVLVARNPCLHPGDLQKLRVVARPELSHLLDCIVFPVKGKRPAADMMSGGDLDGDTFFVCWDKDLIPSTIAEAAEYPGPKESAQFGKITTADRIDYFSNASSAQLGQVKNLYLKWARACGAQSSQCQELNRLFSQCVDASKITIPDRLREIPQSSKEDAFILDVLHGQAMEYNRKPRLSHRDIEAESGDELAAILAHPVGYTQFELARMTLRWCRMHHTSFEEFQHFFDTTLLSADEKWWFIAQLAPREFAIESVNNDLWHSDLLSINELRLLGLTEPKIAWKLVYSSETDRLANLLDVFCRVFPHVTRKMLVLKINDRLSVAIYLPTTIPFEDEAQLSPQTRIFAIPHNRAGIGGDRVVVPPKYNTRFYYDHGGFRIYEGKYSNTFIFFTKGSEDTSRYADIRAPGNRARARQQTIDAGENQEWRTSIALNKFNQTLAQYIGRLNREGVAAAELYVISNTDQRSFRNLDLWLEQVDTDQISRNFEAAPKEENVGMVLAAPNLSEEAPAVRRMLDKAHTLAFYDARPEEISRALQLAWQHDSRDRIAHWFKGLTQSPRRLDAPAFEEFIQFLDFMPTAVVHFFQFESTAISGFAPLLDSSKHALSALRAIILCVNKMERLALNCLESILLKIDGIKIQDLVSLVELILLTVGSVDIAMSILVEYLEPLTHRILDHGIADKSYVMRQLSGIAVNFIEEAANLTKDARKIDYQWTFECAVVQDQGVFLLDCDYRIDAPLGVQLKVGDNLRFICVECPSAFFIHQIDAFEVLVVRAEVGRIRLRCLRHPPAMYRMCVWRHENRGSIVTSQTMMQAIERLCVEKEACCPIYSNLFTASKVVKSEVTTTTNLTKLNSSQQLAVTEALRSPITCIWGPPGTGKTHTTVSIIKEILAIPDARLLVTAPTHTAVDNILRRLLKDKIASRPVRVATDFHRVSADLKEYTCDAMVGKDVNQHPSSRRKAQKQISQSRLVFSTCNGAGLGLLRDERFENVIIDEASQQTEAESLIPIVKGCSRLVLVGDHVQLRAVVQPHAMALDFDVSLFEALWTGDREVSRVMLDTQYRMHPTVCEFPSNEFYEGRLKSGAHCERITLPYPESTWPQGQRLLFIQCSMAEDLGRSSKSNKGQAEICQTFVSRLRNSSSGGDQSIVILTPYTRQADFLKQALPAETVSSVNSFQGQEADIVVYVSVRCNAHGEIGFLKDMRRLNVALTRARTGIVIIGDEHTLNGDNARSEEPYYLTWKRLIRACHSYCIDVTTAS